MAIEGLQVAWEEIKSSRLIPKKEHMSEDAFLICLILSSLGVIYLAYRMLLGLKIARRAKRLGLDVLNLALGIRGKMAQGIVQLKKDVHKAKLISISPVFSSLPKLTDAEIIERLEKVRSFDRIKEDTGKQGANYFHSRTEGTKDFVSNLSKDFFYTNPMHFDSCPGSQLIENELIRFMLELNNAPKGSVGTTTTGGTESLLLAMLTYREYGYKQGIAEPEVIMPESAHAAFLKAAFLFKIKIRLLPCNQDTGEVTVKQYLKAINSSTVAVVCSGSTWAHGAIDPVEELSQALQNTDIWIHVDNCLGGYMSTASALKGDNRIPVIDFRNSRVGTISVDPHKYGESPKGCSLILFRNDTLKKHSLFHYMNWNGGIYATPSLPGSRSAAAYVGAWVSIVRLGKEGLIANYDDLVATMDQVVEDLKSCPEIKVIGTPKSCVVTFTVTQQSKLTIFDIHEALKKDGWDLPMMQKPFAIHITVTRHNMHNLRTKFRNSMKQAIEYARSRPDCSNGSFNRAIYCSLLKVPDGDMVEDAIKTLLVEINKLSIDD